MHFLTTGTLLGVRSYLPEQTSLDNLNQEKQRSKSEDESLAWQISPSTISEYFYRCVKRAIDIILSGLLLIQLMPLLLFLCFLIVMESQGCPIFRQKRIGARGRVFDIYKLRTMYQGTAQDDYKTKNGDPRVTRLGRILRITKLDELPQLLNVFLGDMTLIGPRPLSVAECVALIVERGFSARHHGFVPAVKPGLIGLEQINRHRKLSYRLRFKLNQIYQRKLCPITDLTIFSKALLMCWPVSLVTLALAGYEGLCVCLLVL